MTGCRPATVLLQSAVSALGLLVASAGTAQAPIREDPRPVVLRAPIEATVAGAPVRDGQAAIEQRQQTGDILTIAELAGSHRKGGTHAGLYVANMAGRVFLHTTDKINTQRSVVSDLSLRSQSLRPLDMAFADPYLYVYDGDAKQVVALEPELRSLEPIHTFDVRFEKPSHITVSANGLVAVLDGGTLVLQEKGRAPFRYSLKELSSKPAGFNFSAWDTLHILDGGRRSLLTLTLNRRKDESFRVRSEVSRLPKQMAWRAMTVFEGNLYFASNDQVYAYLDSEKTVLPVLPSSYQFDGIDQIALTHDGLYVLHDNLLEWVPRGEPIDVVLEGTLNEGREALFELYRYLHSIDFLPLREVRSPRDFSEGEMLLAATGALIGPPIVPPAEVVRTYAERQKYAYQTKLLEKKAVNVKGHRAWSRGGGPSREPSSEAWNALVCSFSNCRSFQGVQAGQSMQVPDVLISSRLARERVVLTGETLAATLDRLVFSEELKDRATPSLIRRLNPQHQNTADEELLGLTSGGLLVPVEKWTVTLAVPANDFERRDSRLWQIAEKNGHVSLFSRGAFVEFSAKSTAHSTSSTPSFHSNYPAMQPPPPDESEAHCSALQEALSRWHDLIQYPDGSSEAGLEKPIRIGILESKSTVQFAHHAFSLSADAPTWHEAIDFDLNAVPNPAAVNGPLPVPILSLVAFSKEAHHGNHVAGLIGGRRSDCWSGLLPNARLVLIDLTDGGRLQRAIANSIDAEVRVFNVSQVFEGSQDSLKQTMLSEGRALWVVAAGNDGKDLNTADSVPAPARWGQSPNVVTVSASTWDGNLIETVVDARGTTLGTNSGKLFVDLVAPGKDLISAIEDNIYGPASGTSQAAPQVAAAAALLVDRLGARLTPGDAKARLIATAQWIPTYLDRVWGGRLDFDAAVAFPEHNTLRTTTGLDDLFTVEFTGNPRIVIEGAPRYYERRGAGALAPERIAFSRILSLRKQSDGTYRVVLRQPGTDRLKILINVRLRDHRNRRIRCTRFDRWDTTNQAFTAANGCDQGFSITQIEEYIQGNDYQIEWGD